MNNKRITTIAVTGGPCGGKSTLMARASEWLGSYGIHAIIVSETATELMNANIHPGIIQLENFEKNMAIYQVLRENIYFSLAKLTSEKGRPVVVLCDRGAPDCGAYIAKDVFERIITELDYSKSELLNRYEAVIHLTTTAIGAEGFYTLENNRARSESIEEARELDKKTEQAWLGHPHHFIIDNRTGFDEKILRAMRAISTVLGIPEPTETERKFRILNFNPSFIPPEAVALKITQNYLWSDEKIERRIRVSELDGQKTFFYTEKSETGKAGVRIEKESIITEEEYFRIHAEINTILSTIRKTRYCFVYYGKKFELDIYESPNSLGSLAILEVELIDMEEEIKFPFGWLLEEVTEDDNFKNRNLARYV